MRKWPECYPLTHLLTTMAFSPPGGYLFTALFTLHRERDRSFPSRESVGNPVLPADRRWGTRRTNSDALRTGQSHAVIKRLAYRRKLILYRAEGSSMWHRSASSKDVLFCNLRMGEMSLLVLLRCISDVLQLLGAQTNHRQRQDDLIWGVCDRLPACGLYMNDVAASVIPNKCVTKLDQPFYCPT